MKTKVHHFHNETWGEDFCLVFPATNDDLKRVIERYYPKGAKAEDDLDDNGFSGRCFRVMDKGGESLGIIIALASWKGKPVDWAILAHECLHAVQWTLDACGLKMNDTNDEAFCYLLDWLVQYCGEILVRRK